MTGSSQQQYGESVPRTQGLGHELLEYPRGLALRFMRHDGLLGAPDHDDVLSDAMWGIAKALASYDDRDEHGVSITTWCWWKMRHEVWHGRRHRSRFDREDLVDWADADPGAADRAETDRRRSTIPDPDALRVDLIEHGYKQVDDRATLQRWADMAHLTDTQADLVAWFAVHVGTILRGTPYAGQRSPLSSRTSILNSALGRLRRVAVTGRPFVRWGGNKYTGSLIEDITTGDVRAAVDG